MKHGRRHKTLKEQTYGHRFHQDAEGYARPYRPIDVAQPSGDFEPEPVEEAPVAARLTTRDKKRLRYLGIDVEDE